MTEDKRITKERLRKFIPLTWFDVIILIGTFFFFPLFFAISLYRTYRVRDQLFRKTVGFILMFFQSFSICLAVAGGFNWWVQPIQVYAVIIFGLLFIVFLFQAANINDRRAHVAQRYWEIIIEQGIVHLGEIAKRSKQTEEAVIDDIGLFVKHGVFPKGSFQAGVLQLKEPYLRFKHPRQFFNVNMNVNMTKLPKSVECPGCGSKITVPPDKSVECEYCGGAVSYA